MNFPHLRTLGVVIGLLGTATVPTGCSPPEQRLSGARRELVFERLTSAALAKVPGARVLVVGNPFAALPGARGELVEADRAAVRGVEKATTAVGARYLGVAVPALSEQARRDPSSVPIPAGATTPIGFMTERGAWDGIRETRREANLWISLIGVPADLATTRAWTDTDGPRWALFSPDPRLIGTRDEIRAALENGRLVAMVFPRPGAPSEALPMGADATAEFEARWLLVTRESFEGTVAAWPQLIP